MSPTRRASAILVILASAPAAAQDAERTFENTAWGFRLTLPDAAWMATENQDSGGAFSVTITRKSAGSGAAGASVRAERATGSDGAPSVRDATLEAIRGQPGYSGARAIEGVLFGQKAPGIEMIYRPGDGAGYLVRQHYLESDGIRYVVARFAAADDPGSGDCAAAARIAESFALLPPSPAALRERRLRALAERCDAGVRWAPTWKEAARRARESRRLVLVHAWLYGGFEVPPLARHGVFLDPHVVDLMNERFVPWKFRRGEDAPFEREGGYGIGASAFGAAILLVTPDGRVVEESCHLHARAVDDFLRTSLARHPEAGGEAPPPDPGGVLSRSRRMLQRGEIDAAVSLLDEAAADAPGLRAGIHFRRGENAAALAVLEHARSPDGTPDDAALALDHAALLIELGRREEALAILESAACAAPAPALETQWLFLRGWTAFAGEGPAAAAASWNRIVDGHPGCRFAPFAAAALLSPELAPIARASQAPLDAAGLAALRRVEPDPLPLSGAARAADGGAAWLRSAQHADGTWTLGLEAGIGRAGPAPLRDAVTALAGAALLRRRGDPACGASAGRALAAVLRAVRREAAASPEPYVDYTPWALAFGLDFLAEALVAGAGDPPEIRGVARAMIARLRELRRPSGGWSYYLSPAPGPAATLPSGSMSFTTAAVVLGLLRIRGAGVRVPEDLLESSLGLLEGARDEHGAFDYQAAGSGDRQAATRFDPGAAGRGPLVELALLRGGRGGVERLRSALARLREHGPLLARERGKALMHAGAGGLGCHYLLCDWAFAAEAVRELPEGERAAFRDHVLEQVLACRLRHGGFQDTPVNGCAAGTALALRALDAR